MRTVMVCALAMSACVAAEAKERGKLLPVVFAARDIAAGETLTFDMIAQRVVPESFAATTSIVKPDSASYIVNQRLNFPVLEGDAMLWSFFETTTDKATTTACDEAVKLPGSARQQLATLRTLVLSR
jgi:hypothetical protein